MRFWCVLALAVISCKRDVSERDRKDRAELVTADGATRDPMLVETGEVTITWNGAIVESTGKAPGIATACTMTSRLRSLANDSISEEQTIVRCGAQTLYDEASEVSGDSKWVYSLGEHPVSGQASTFAYTSKGSDLGARTGDRNQMTVSTKDGELVVFREVAPTFRVKIGIVSMSAPRHGKPLFEEDIPPFKDVAKVMATLTSSKGTLPFTGKTCELRISPGWTKQNCMVELECSGKMIFGANGSGYEHCAIDHGKPATFSDTDPTIKDQDPELTADLIAKTATLADVLADGTTYSATFTLQ